MNELIEKVDLLIGQLEATQNDLLDYIETARREGREGASEEGIDVKALVSAYAMCDKAIEQLNRHKKKLTEWNE